jgi:hypothetical protein
VLVFFFVLIVTFPKIANADHRRDKLKPNPHINEFVSLDEITLENLGCKTLFRPVTNNFHWFIRKCLKTASHSNFSS